MISMHCWTCVHGAYSNPENLYGYRYHTCICLALALLKILWPIEPRTISEWVSHKVEYSYGFLKWEIIPYLLIVYIFTCRRVVCQTRHNKRTQCLSVCSRLVSWNIIRLVRNAPSPLSGPASAFKCPCHTFYDSFDARIYCIIWMSYAYFKA